MSPANAGVANTTLVPFEAVYSEDVNLTPLMNTSRKSTL